MRAETSAVQNEPERLSRHKVSLSMHPRDCIKLKVRRHQLDSMKKKVNDVANGDEVNPRTRNIESDHQGRLSQSKNEKVKIL